MSSECCGERVNDVTIMVCISVRRIDRYVLYGHFHVETFRGLPAVPRYDPNDNSYLLSSDPT